MYYIDISSRLNSNHEYAKNLKRFNKNIEKKRTMKRTKAVVLVSNNKLTMFKFFVAVIVVFIVSNTEVYIFMNFIELYIIY